ncbi:lipoxygenase [Bisporella sp. PMI_857]|nr:lipoxygenase [Bisporella sp. PMI_857]
MRVNLLVTAGLGAANVNGAALPKRQANASLATLPQYDDDPVSRAASVEVKRAGFLYGPSLMGDAAFFPTGSLGTTTVNRDFALFYADHAPSTQRAILDHRTASAAINASGGLNSLEDYVTKLYNGQWKTSVPDGVYPGVLTNYTQDLYFSMERLSLNPYPLKRFSADAALPFLVDDEIVTKLSGLTLFELQSSGRLFVVDHSYQAKYAKTERFGAAATAYFYLHPKSGDFLPLAIATNTEANLVYTPLDSENDWLLAKIIFNGNDLAHSQLYHLVASHDVAEIVQEAAIRTLSDEHPILAILTRLMYQAFAIRVAGTDLLTKPGGSIDLYFYLNSTGAAQFVAEFWRNGGGNYESNYLATDFAARGILPDASSHLPQFKNFPFYEDASKIRESQHDFFTTFVDSYYPAASDVEADTEVQAWFAEANGPAQVLDFPTTASKPVLVEVLTHFAFLCGVAHHALNTNNAFAALGTLPFHPFALYQSLPTEKGLTDLLPFLPPLEQALGQMDLTARFNCQDLDLTNRTLIWAFSDPALLGTLKPEVGVAAAKFKEEMEAFSKVVRGRGFGENGLSEGLPFVYFDLDPGTVPFYLAI